MTETLPADSEITALWKDYRPTALVELPDLARLTNVGRVFVKSEGERPLGNFKVLGGMVAGLRALARSAGVATMQDLDRVRGESLPRLICASDGNHGLAVATAARRAGTKASIYLPTGVSRIRADRIEACGGDIVWISGAYDDAVRDAAAAASRGEGLLIPDTSPDPDDVVVRDVMAGYALLTRELVSQFRDEVMDRPSHLFVQAGVGGLAAAMAEGLRDSMREPRKILVVEPESAACVAAALEAGHPAPISGDLHTCAEMLSCGLASASAVEVLLRHEVQAILVDEERLQTAVSVMRDSGGPHTTPSGAAGLAGFLYVAARPALRAAHRFEPDSCALLVASEGP